MSTAQLAALETLIKQDGVPRGADLKLALTKLSSEIQQRASNGSSAADDFLADAVNVISRVKGTVHADLRLQCLVESCLFFYRSGQAKAGLQACDAIRDLARRIDSKPWARKGETMSGIIYAEGGNIAEAVMHYCEALRLAREMGDRWAEAATLTNLGSAFLYASLYGEAIKCFHRAIDLCDDPKLRNIGAAAYCDLAQAYLAVEDYQRGFTAIEQCLHISEEPTDHASHFSRTIREFTYVQLALELGKLAKAREHAASVRRYGHWGNNTRCLTLAQLATGMCEIRGGDVKKGLALLEGALDITGDFIVTRIDVLNALVRAYDDVGQPERSLHYLTELMTVVRRMREQSIGVIVTLGGAENIHATGHASEQRALQLREARLRAKVAENEFLSSQLEMLERLAITADLREEVSGQHGYRVGRLAGLMAERLGFDADFVRDIETAARLHDLGKLGVPDRILQMSAELKTAERELMKSHTSIGAELLGKSRFAKVQLAEEVARWHHEWWDGTGYPSKLSGRRIPIHARIVALADVFDAATHGRAYSPAWTIDRTLAEMISKRGTQFDPDLTDTFVTLISDLRRKHDDLDSFFGEGSRNSPFLQAREKIRLMLDSSLQAENIAAARAEALH